MEQTTKQAFENILEIRKLTDQYSNSFNEETGTFDTEILNKLEGLIQKQRNLNLRNYVHKISLRVAAIIVIEETMIRKNCSRDFLELLSIFNQAKVRYRTQITNRSTKGFASIESIHPKHPCIFYDATTSNQKFNHSNRAKRGRYRQSLEKILHGKDWLDILDETETRISDALSIVKLC
jgi:hypothetical protein